MFVGVAFLLFISEPYYFDCYDDTVIGADV